MIIDGGTAIVFAYVLVSMEPRVRAIEQGSSTPPFILNPPRAQQRRTSPAARPRHPPIPPGFRGIMGRVDRHLMSIFDENRWTGGRLNSVTGGRGHWIKPSAAKAAYLVLQHGWWLIYQAEMNLRRTITRLFESLGPPFSCSHRARADLIYAGSAESARG
jgi:hypothetical protein